MGARVRAPRPDAGHRDVDAQRRRSLSRAGPGEVTALAARRPPALAPSASDRAGSPARRLLVASILAAAAPLFGCERRAGALAAPPGSVRDPVARSEPP